MHVRMGVIFLDGAEVIVAIYKLTRDLKWQKLVFFNRELNSFEVQKQVDVQEIIETLVEVLALGYKLKLRRWRILSRNLSDEVIEQIIRATKLKIRSLGLVEEQELICRGSLE